MYRTPSFGDRTGSSSSSGSRDGERTRNGSSSGFSASTSNLDRLHVGSGSNGSNSPIPRKGSTSASTLGSARRETGSTTNLERSGSYLSRYVPLSERGITLKSGTTSSSSNIPGNGNDNNNNNATKGYTSVTSLTDRRTARDGFFTSSSTTAVGGSDRGKYESRSRHATDSSSKDRDIMEKEKITSSSSIQSYHTSQHEKPVKETDGYVGFANLPNQVYRKSVKKGFEFTLMVVGESGLGKSTLINSMFLTDLYSAEYPGPSHRIKKTVQVETTQVLLKEGGVELKLTVVDTPGFGDAVDNSNCWQPIIESIEKKYDEYLNAESRVNRKINPDSRVHCCLYFIAPNGHGLKPLDVEFMKRLHDKVNIIPLIAKADTMTPDECREFKKTVLNEIAQHKIKIYEFPDPDDEEEVKIQKRLKERVPFAVVGSNTVVDSNGRKVRGRIYPWGIVEVENLDHNDFIALRNMLIRTHMQDLKDVTNNVHYENFRYNKLAACTSSKGATKGQSGNPPSQPVPATRKKRVGRSSSVSNPFKDKPLVRHTFSEGSSVHRRKPSSSGSSTASSTLTHDDLQLMSDGTTSEFGPSDDTLSMATLDDDDDRGRFTDAERCNTPGRNCNNNVGGERAVSRGEMLDYEGMKERVKTIFRLTRKLVKRTSSFAPKSMGNRNPLLQMEDEKSEHVNKMKKMEAEMEQVFEMKVKEKMQKLKESESDLERRAEQMKKSLEQQSRELEDKRDQFEKERALFEQQEEERRRTLETMKKQKKSLF